LLALGSATKAAAGDEAQDWYAGLATSETHVEVYRPSFLFGGWEESGSTHEYLLRGGRRLTRHLAVELGMQRSSGLQWQEYAATVPDLPGTYESSVSFDASALQLGLVGILYAGKFEFYIGGGLAKYRLSGEQTLDDWWSDTTIERAVHESGTGYLIGVGVGTDILQKWRVRLDTQFYTIAQEFLGVATDEDATVDTISIGVDYRFGARARDR
jgi:opacity protein-like surface antigen